MRRITTLLTAIWCIATMVCCAPSQAPERTLSGLNPARFETRINGKKVELYTLRNKGGMEVCISNFGARIISLMTVDRDGIFRDVVLGFDNIEEYVERGVAMGATVGRFAGRIADGLITIDGKEYQIDVNEEPSNCALHGGPKGWMNEVFDVERAESHRITMTYKAKDGENGFPGDVDLKVTYLLTDSNEVVVEYDATSSAPTVVNLTHHSFFNLSGDSSRSIVDHQLRVNADYIATLDTVKLAPDGNLRKVEGTPMDLREKVVIGDIIDRYDDDQLRAKEGLDHAWFFSEPDPMFYQSPIYLKSPMTGITMNVYTDQPAVHIYSSNFMDTTVMGRNSRPFVRRGAICFETQHTLDCVPELHPGGRYKYYCVYEFGRE